jgi:altronate dehydratase
LCSAQVSRLAAERLNEKRLGRAQGISRFEALAHTEGCGSSGESLFRLLGRSYRGYLTHPNVAAALLLEHGCEKTTNDVMRAELERAGLSSARFGWASVQLDGGIAKALDKIEAWFVQRLASLPPTTQVLTDLGALSLGLMTAAGVNDAAAAALAAVTCAIVGRGGSVLIPEQDALLGSSTFRVGAFASLVPHATLAYGQSPTEPGLHIIASETDHWVENLTGLGGCGAHLVLTVISGHTRQGHPLLPVIQVAESSQRGVLVAEDVDLFIPEDSHEAASALEELLVAVAELRRRPVVNAQGFVDFQFTRGLLGVTS